MAAEKIVMDATGKAPGRLATEIVRILMGKHKATYTPHIDDGDAVEVQNAAAMKTHSSKMVDKLYYKHTLYPGNMKIRQMKEVWAADPTEVLKLAVEKMLPRNKMYAARINRLTIK